MPLGSTDAVQIGAGAFQRQLSACMSPFRVVNSLPSDVGRHRPPGLKGWEDVLHKQELRDRDICEIHCLQADHGYELTHFGPWVYTRMETEAKPCLREVSPLDVLKMLNFALSAHVSSDGTDIADELD